MPELRIVRAEGDPTTRGRQIGRTLGDLIEASLGFQHDYLEHRGLVPEVLQRQLHPYLNAADNRLPSCAAILHGMAAGAMVPVWELLAVNALDEVGAELNVAAAQDRSSTFTVAGPGFTLMGHNEHWPAGDAANVAVVVEYPVDDEPPVAGPTVVSRLVTSGINGHWGAHASAGLRARDGRPGVPRLLVARHALGSADRVDAILRTKPAWRGSGDGHVFAFAGGDAFAVETTAAEDSVLEGPGPHTNHFLDPALADLAPPPSDGSLARYERLMEVIEDTDPRTPEDMMSVLGDHASSPEEICRHPAPGSGPEAMTVAFSMVCDLEGGRMWVAPGSPCTTPFEEIELAGVLEHREA